MSNKINNLISDEDTSFSRTLAARLRQERANRGWSIAELALASGVSKAMISKIERAETSPTAALLGRLSGAFGLSISTLLASTEPLNADDRVVRQADQEIWQDPETGYVRRAITPPGADPEMISVELPPGASVSYPASSYSFVRGHSVWMIGGRLEITEGHQTATLTKGDCFVFDLSIPSERTYHNPSKNTTARYMVTLARR